MLNSEKQYDNYSDLADKALEALKLASLEARKVAIQTNTNLIIYDKEKGIQKIPASELAKEQIK